MDVRARPPHGVHHHERRAEVRGGPRRAHAVPQARHVVDDVRARPKRLPRHSALVRVHGDQHARQGAGDGLHDRDHALQLLVQPHGRRARAVGLPLRPRALPAHVDDRGARGPHLARAVQRRLHARVAPPVRERVRGHVEHAHDVRPAGAAVQRAPPARQRPPRVRPSAGGLGRRRGGGHGRRCVGAKRYAPAVRPGLWRGAGRGPLARRQRRYGVASALARSARQRP